MSNQLDDPIKQHYWVRLRELRIKANLDQAALARRSRLSRMSVINYEKGVYEPTLQAAVQLVIGLGLKGLDELIMVDMEALKKLIESNLAPPVQPKKKGWPKGKPRKLRPDGEPVMEAASEPAGPESSTAKMPEPTPQIVAPPAEADLELQPEQPKIKIGMEAVFPAEFKDPVGEILSEQEKQAAEKGPGAE